MIPQKYLYSDVFLSSPDIDLEKILKLDRWTLISILQNAMSSGFVLATLKVEQRGHLTGTVFQLFFSVEYKGQERKTSIVLAVSSALSIRSVYINLDNMYTIYVYKLDDQSL